MSKRFGLLAMLIVVGIVAAAAVVAQAGGDSTSPECASRYVAVGDVLPSDKSVHPTPIDAAAIFASNMSVDGEPMAANAEFVDVTGSDAMDVNGEKVIAAQVEGTTKIVMGLSQQGGGWVVESFVSC